MKGKKGSSTDVIVLCSIFIIVFSFFIFGYYIYSDVTNDRNYCVDRLGEDARVGDNRMEIGYIECCQPIYENHVARKEYCKVFERDGQ